MPKQTFLNLPKAKREAFLEAAVEEFAMRDYESASVSQIVAKLGIAKGSVYQYFDDKRDLYLYLIAWASEERIAFTDHATGPDLRDGLFAYTQWLLEMGVRFTFARPRLSQLMYRAMFGAAPFRDEALQRMRASALETIRQLLAQGVATGELDPDLDLDLVAYLLSLMASDFSDFLVSKLALDPQRLIRGDYSQLDLDAMRDVFAKATEFIWWGIAKRPS